MGWAPEAVKAPSQQFRASLSCHHHHLPVHQKLSKIWNCTCCQGNLSMLAKAYLLQITPPKNPQRTLMFSLDSKNQIRTRRQTWSPYIARVRYVQKTWTGQSPITTAMSPANMINADGSPTIDPEQNQSCTCELHYSLLSCFVPNSCLIFY
jgi:ribosomal protein L37AE/L43A